MNQQANVQTAFQANIQPAPQFQPVQVIPVQVIPQEAMSVTTGPVLQHQYEPEPSSLIEQNEMV
jgi:hypothetical protein